MAFDITGSKSLVARSQHLARAAWILCGVLFLAPLANVALAVDAKDEIIKILDETIPQLQSTMASLSVGCSGGSSGVPPLNWSSRQAPGNAAVKTLVDARTALAAAQTLDDAAKQRIKQQINSALSQWDTLINGLAGSCSGGGSGQNPVSYGNYVNFRNILTHLIQPVWNLS
jgi:hypothetical protein